MDQNLEVCCPTCQKPMTFTGLPDVSGPIHFRFYRCSEHGVIRVDVPDESKEGYG